jgi:hypothetical protein
LFQKFASGCSFTFITGVSLLFQVSSESIINYRWGKTIEMEFQMKIQKLKLSVFILVIAAALLAGANIVYAQTKTDNQNARKAGVGEDRAEFVKFFYEYAKANPDGKPLLWSEWIIKK